MLFAHGFGCDQNMWRFVAPAFEKVSRSFYSITSARAAPTSRHMVPPKYSTLSGYADDVVEIGRDLGLQDAVFVGLFGAELRRFERSPAKALKNNDRTEYIRRRTDLLDQLTKDPVKLPESIARHFSGEMSLGIVIVFDNVDKRSRDQQLAIFEATQWFKDLTKSLVLINLRDSTFEAHRDEAPLDAFINAINFYIRPPRFAQVIRKRLELVMETLQTEVDPQQEYALASGLKIKYPATRLGEFLLGIYLSMFNDRSGKVASSLEALVAKDVRRALGMFGDIIVSPHIPTGQITSSVLSGGEIRIRENPIIRALMRGHQKYYNGRSLYIHKHPVRRPGLQPAEQSADPRYP
jgi:hypothetical protein